MADNNSTVKAERAIIDLGGIPLDVLQIPNGEYRLSQSQAAGVLNKQAKRLIQAVSSEDFKDFSGGRPVLILKVKLVDNNATINTISVSDVSTYWAYEAAVSEDKATRLKAAKLLAANTAESIERRADTAFGKKRTEEEYNDRTKERREGKNVRLTLTDAIKSYLDRTPGLSEGKRNFMYSNVTDRINRGVFGRCAKELRQDFKCENPRDAMTPLELRYVKEAEDLTARLIEYTGLEPMEATAEAIRRLEIPEQDRVA